MYTLVKKLCKAAAILGIALIICGVAAGMMLSDFKEHAVETQAYITTVEEGGVFTNGYKVNLRYTVDGKKYDGSIDSGNLGEAFRLLEAKAEASNMNIIDYVDEVSNKEKTVMICYNSEIPASIKYAGYEEESNDFYTWGIIALVGSIVVAVVNSTMKKKKEERAAEKRLEKKQAKQQGR